MTVKVEYNIFDANGKATFKTARSTGIPMKAEEETFEFLRNTIREAEVTDNIRLMRWVESV